MDKEIQKVQDEIQKIYPKLEETKNEIKKVLVGQEMLVDRLLIGLISGGHILIEGLPGLAKTLAVKSLSDCIQTKFQRIQFTPDLLPADIIGTMIFNPKEGDFSLKKGPIFSNIVLADEINRAPSKVQSALLEAMQEKQVSIGEETFKLEEPFLVLATQNPLEQEGTYPLPEAQVDRFMLKLKVFYPNRPEERLILDSMTKMEIPELNPTLKPEDILKLRKLSTDVYVDEKIKEYILDIIFATREPDNFGLKDLTPLISCGASPRATIAITKAAKTHALLHGRGFVTPDDIKDIGYDILRHRILTTYEAQAEDLDTDNIIEKVFDAIKVP